MDLFFELIQIALEKRDELSHTPTEEEWEKARRIATKQSLLGICSKAVEKLSKEQRPPRALYLRWLSLGMATEQWNEKLLRTYAECRQELNSKLLGACLIKGYSISAYYGPMAPFRQSGDIDIWTWPLNEDGTPDLSMSSRKRRRQIISYALSKSPSSKPVYHNVAYKVEDRVNVELHFTPSWFFSPFTNYRFQRWVNKEVPSQFANTLSLPDGQTLAAVNLQFNMVHALLHIFRHLLGEGIGLRQVVDYYFILKASSRQEREETLRLVKSFKMERFTKGLMWVLNSFLGLEKEYLLCEPDKERGSFIMSEILQAGNFGKFDKRIDRTRHNGKAGMFYKRVKRNMRFFTISPSEVLWCPIWKVWHQIWILFSSPSSTFQYADSRKIQ